MQYERTQTLGISNWMTVISLCFQNWHRHWSDRSFGIWSLKILPTLSKSAETIYGPDHKPLEVVCEADVNLRSNRECSVQKVFVVKGLSNNLLSLLAIKILSLLQYVNGIQNNDIFQDLFTGLGKKNIISSLNLIQFHLHYWWRWNPSGLKLYTSSRHPHLSHNWRDSCQLNRFSPNIVALSQPLQELFSHFQRQGWNILTTSVRPLRCRERNQNQCWYLRVWNGGSHCFRNMGLIGDQLPSHREPSWTRSLVTHKLRRKHWALTWSCEKFSSYILAKPVRLETDHKQLVPVLGQKSLDSLPPRVLTV